MPSRHAGHGRIRDIEDGFVVIRGLDGAELLRDEVNNGFGVRELGSR